MASQNNADKDIIPIGKAIAIIVSVVFVGIVIIGGVLFFILNMNTSKEKTYKIDFDGDKLIFDGYTYKEGDIATSSQSNQNASNKENVASPSLPSEDEKTLATDWNTILGEWKFTAYDYRGFRSSATEGTINIKEIKERTIVVDIKTDISTALNESLLYKLDEKKENLTFKYEWMMAERGLILDKNHNWVQGTVNYRYTFNFTENGGSLEEFAILYNGETNTVYATLDKNVLLNRFTDTAILEQAEDIIHLPQDLMNGEDSEMQAMSNETYSILENAFSLYVLEMTNAINEGNFSIVEPYLVYDSDLYNSQKALVDNLYSRGITETPLDMGIISYEMVSDGVYKVKTYEIIEITYPNESKVNNYNYTYTYYENRGFGAIE